MAHAKVDPEEVRAEIKRLLAEVLEIEPEEIADDASFAGDLDLDSLTALEVMVGASKKYRIDIPGEEMERLDNVNDTVKIVTFFLEKSQSEADKAAGS